MRKPLLSGSILDADFAELLRHVEAAIRGGVDLLHFDVADTSFAPTVSFGPRVAACLLRRVKVPGEAHIMVKDPDPLIRQLSEAGVSRVYLHAEASRSPFRLLAGVRDLGLEPAIALNPVTSVGSVELLLPEVSAVLVLLVEPGLGGQKMLRSALRKVSQLRELREREGYGYLIAADGGIKAENVGDVVRAGADIVVVGSAIFASGDPEAAAREVKARMLEHVGGAPVDLGRERPRPQPP
ncbi:MAG: ribulose-phosphate 3-epimerase [Thermofilaceae archaeon]